MFLLRLMIKVILLPLMIVMIFLQWIGIFLIGIAGSILNILAFLFTLTAGAAFLTGLASGPEALKMLAIGFVIFILPHIAEWIVMKITAVRCSLADFLRS